MALPGTWCQNGDAAPRTNKGVTNYGVKARELHRERIRVLPCIFVDCVHFQKVDLVRGENGTISRAWSSIAKGHVIVGWPPEAIARIATKAIARAI